MVNLSSTLLLMQVLVKQASMRLAPQMALESYYSDVQSTDDQWDRTAEDYDAIFAGDENTRIAVQARIYHKEGSDRILFSRTASSVANVTLPYDGSDGQPALMGDYLYGYVPELYPQFNVRAMNRTSDQYDAEYQGRVINKTDSLLSGPYRVSDSLTLLSITTPIVNTNTSSPRIIGWLTVVLDAQLLNNVLAAREGLGESGLSLLFGPYNVTNNFPAGYLFDSTDVEPPERVEVQYQGPSTQSEDAQWHFQYETDQEPPHFDWLQYPAIREGFTHATGNSNNAGSMVSTRNEQNHHVAVGYALVNNSMVDWIVIVERSHAEVWSPINRLRRIILTCVFGTMACMLLVTMPVAHYSSKPVRRLRNATREALLPNFPEEDHSSGQNTPDDEIGKVLAHKGGLFGRIVYYGKSFAVHRAQKQEASKSRPFRVPNKVKDRRHFFHDELTDLTTTFNEMTDELRMQYGTLDERVQQRTAELELSKQAAEAANESKTLFIANISHELKTPLNGIMDLDEKEFRLGDIGSQVLAIFGQQAKEGKVTLSVKFEDLCHVRSYEEAQTSERSNTGLSLGPTEDMLLYGDEHRIVQVILNLVSNSLKFTPAGGSVTVTIRCRKEAHMSDARTASIQSRRSSLTQSQAKATANASVLEFMHAPIVVRLESQHPTRVARRQATPPTERWLEFEFEFEVADTGPGIPKHLHSKIFEPFVQGDLGLNKKYGGTGLGLSICSQLASLMRGTIRVDSNVGHGSVFVMSIPLKYVGRRAEGPASSSVDLAMVAPPSQGSPVDETWVVRRTGDAHSMRPAYASLAVVDRPPSTASSTVALGTYPEPHLVSVSQSPFVSASIPKPSKPQEVLWERAEADVTKHRETTKVLVAEDNRTNQEVITRMLKLEDLHNVTVAADGQEALDRVRESIQNLDLYDLVFMDVQMPNLDGLQATRLIRQLGFKAPIVALTAYTEETNVQQCLDSGMNFFLSKPIRRSAIKQVLEKYCLGVYRGGGEASDPAATEVVQMGVASIFEIQEKNHGSPRPGKAAS
ncbi:Histidine kinase osmosensor [Didymella pomorum]